MKSSPNTVRWRKGRLTTRSGVRSQATFAHSPHISVQNARRNYERYLELARAEAVAGNPVGAENYYQHAEHYFRSMYSPRETDNSE
jgi:hypothetical protein